MKGRIFFLFSLILLWGICSCTGKESPSTASPAIPSGKESPEIHGTPVITGDYEYDGYFSMIIKGTCNVEPLLGVSVKYGIMYSDSDLTTDAETKDAETKDDKNRFSCTITVEPGTLYYYRAFAIRGGETFYGEIKSFKAKELIPTSGNAIDMGVSVKWASCNLGATKPEEDGNEYAWGETQTKSNYTPENYKYFVRKVEYDAHMIWYEYSKYTSSDGKKVLDLNDDAANVNLHGNWRMPTVEEIAELFEKCDKVDNYYYNERAVVTVLISKVTGNILFLSSGNYWSSSLDKSNGQDIGLFNEGGLHRYKGYYIRPVQGPTTSGGGTNTENTIEISVSDITSSSCVVSLHPNASGTYFWEIQDKETYDYYGGDYILNDYISYYKDEGKLKDTLDEGDQQYDYTNLGSKTQYVVFAGYCDANGVVKSKIFTKTFTTK